MKQAKVPFRDRDVIWTARSWLYRFGLRPKEGSFWFSYFLDHMYRKWDKEDKQPIRHGKKR